MYPERGWEFVNRGVSGNTVGDLVKRWETDAVEIKPGVISILVGVNDIGRGVGLEESERAYDGLLAETREKLPGVRLVLLEPFGLPVGKVKEHWAERSAKLAAWRGTVERLGAKHGAVVVKLQKVFDEACGRAPAEYWIWDGVHPTYRGHQLIADEWERVVKGARVGDSATRPKGEGK
jgi:lysophospholipase L1-like esterase